jgi:hypothetical protein
MGHNGAFSNGRAAPNQQQSLVRELVLAGAAARRLFAPRGRHESAGLAQPIRWYAAVDRRLSRMFQKAHGKLKELQQDRKREEAER